MGSRGKNFMKTAIHQLIPEENTSTPSDNSIKHEEFLMCDTALPVTSVKYANVSEAKRQFHLARAGHLRSVSSTWYKRDGTVLYQRFVPWSDHYHKLRDDYNKTQQTKPWLDFIGFENLVKQSFKILKKLHSKKLVFANWNNGLALVGPKIRIFRYAREGSTRAHDAHSFLALIGTLLRGEEILPQNDELTIIPSEPIHISFYLRHGLQKDLAYALVALHDYNDESNVDEFLNVLPFWSSSERSVFIDKLHKFFYKKDHATNDWKEVEQRSKITDDFIADFNQCFIGDEGCVYNWKKIVVDANDKDFIRPILFEGIEPMGVDVGSKYDTQCHHMIAYVKNFIEYPPRDLEMTPDAAEIAVNNKFHFCSDIYVAFRKYLKKSGVREDNDDQSLGPRRLLEFICWDSKVTKGVNKLCHWMEVL